MVCYVTGVLGQNISDDLIERVVSLFDESVVNRRQDTLSVSINVAKSVLLSSIGRTPKPHSHSECKRSENFRITAKNFK